MNRIWFKKKLEWNDYDDKYFNNCRIKICACNEKMDHLKWIRLYHPRSHHRVQELDNVLLIEERSKGYPYFTERNLFNSNKHCVFVTNCKITMLFWFFASFLVILWIQMIDQLLVIVFTYVVHAMMSENVTFFLIVDKKYIKANY